MGSLQRITYRLKNIILLNLNLKVFKVQNRIFPFSFTGNRGGRRPLSAKCHILAFLWFAGHQTASYRDVADRFDITLDSLFKIIPRVSNFLIEMGPRVKKLPDTNEKQVIENHFRLTKGFAGIIGTT